MIDHRDACSLSCSLSPAQLRTRTTLIDAILRNHPHEQIHIPTGRRLAFRADPGLEAHLQQLIELESTCCPFLTIGLERENEQLIFTITGPEDGQAQIADLFR